MHIQVPDRIQALPPYLFAEIDRKKRAAIAAGHDVIDFGVGDPDQPTHPFIIDRMNAALNAPEHHRYPLGGGSPEFRSGIARFMAQRYDVTVDPAAELLALIGSKEGIGHLPLATINPGQTVLVPSPGYPVYRASTVFAGGTPHVFELPADRAYLPDLSALPAEVVDQAALIFLNYPNNPTGALAPLEFFEEAVAWARENHVIIAHDAAYNELYLADERPASILQVEGAREVAVEFHSASKTFNMTGWRIGFAVGNADVIANLARIKANLDSGVFGAIQDAAMHAYDRIDGPELAAMRTLYRERAEMMCATLHEIGFEATPPKATFYLWAQIPAGHDSMSLSARLLDEAHVVGIPGIGFGPSCEGYMRFSLSVPTERTREALERIRRMKW